jgi:hypothetical protein
VSKLLNKIWTVEVHGHTKRNKEEELQQSSDLLSEAIWIIRSKSRPKEERAGEEDRSQSIGLSARINSRWI